MHIVDTDGRGVTDNQDCKCGVRDFACEKCGEIYYHAEESKAVWQLGDVLAYHRQWCDGNIRREAA